MESEREGHSQTSVQELLQSYDRARAELDRLGPFVWSPRSANPGRSNRSLRWPIPRHTWGVRFFLERHIYRTLTALGRHYAAREALGTLSEEDAADRDRCTKYRESISLIRILWILIPCLIVALILGKLIALSVEIVIESMGSLASLGYAFSGNESKPEVLTKEQQESVSDGLDSVVKTFAGSPSEFVEVVGKATEIGAVATLTLSFLIAFLAYLVSRPFVPAFRMKRTLLCIADRSDCDPLSVPSNWYVTKSVGAYRQERDIFVRLGKKPPPEPSVDLWILSFPPAALFLATSWWGDYAIQGGKFGANEAFRAMAGFFASWLLTLFLLRLTWLLCTAKSRKKIASAPPFVGTTNRKEHLTAKSPIAVGSLPLVIAAIYPLLWLSPLDPTFGLSFVLQLVAPWLLIPTWWRLSDTQHRLRWVASSTPRHSLAGRLLSLLFFASLVGTPIALAAFTWRSASLAVAQSRIALRLVAVLGGTLLTPLATAYIILFVVLMNPESYWITGEIWFWTSIGVLILGYSVLFYLAQRTQNVLIRRYSETIHYDPC